MKFHTRGSTGTVHTALLYSAHDTVRGAAPDLTMTTGETSTHASLQTLLSARLAQLGL